jgi:C4-dicarboxylate transporter DctM subunit
MQSFLGFLAFILVLIALMVTRTPVAVALGTIGILGTAIFISPDALRQLGNIAFTQSSNFVLVVVPLFVLMGEALAATGIGNDLFRAAHMWLRRLPGALAVATVFACAVFAAVCGSSPVTAATIGSMAVPEMIKRGYDKALALGTAAAGGTLGILIPPSVPMIIYGVLTETSIGDLFIAGILPGIMMAFLFSATVILKVILRPELAPPLKEGTPWPVKFRALWGIAPVLVLSVLVIGSIYWGIATPTEAGGVGAAGAIVIAGAMGYLRWSVMHRMLDGTVRTTAMFLLLFVGGLFSSFLLTRLGIPQGMSAFLTSFDVPPWVIIVLINLLLLVLGMFLDPTSILIIIVPIFFKTVTALGYDPVWFGVMVTIQIEIAAITPPVGFNLFVLKSVVPGVEMADVVRGSLIFIIPLLLGIVILMIFPQIALFLPALMK